MFMFVKIYHGLEEYRDSVFRKLEFQESEYATYYRDIVYELSKLENSTRRPDTFEDIVPRYHAGRSVRPARSYHFLLTPMN